MSRDSSQTTLHPMRNWLDIVHGLRCIWVYLVWSGGITSSRCEANIWTTEAHPWIVRADEEEFKFSESRRCLKSAPAFGRR